MTHAFASVHTGNVNFFFTSTALLNNRVNGVTVLTKDDGGTFRALSIGITELSVLSNTSVTIPFVGTRSDGSTVTATFNTDGTAGFETFSFSGFNDLVSLSWTQVSPFHQFDDIVLQVAVPFAEFVVEEAEVDLEVDEDDGDPEFSVEGHFTLGSASDGIDLTNDEVTVVFGSLTRSIAAGAFTRDDDEWTYETEEFEISIDDDGEFEIEGVGNIFGVIDAIGPVPFSLTIGDDIGETAITFDDEGEFERDDDDQRLESLRDADRPRGRGRSDAGAISPTGRYPARAPRPAPPDTPPTPPLRPETPNRRLRTR